jgi:hypothetical protein
MEQSIKTIEIVEQNRFFWSNNGTKCYNNGAVVMDVYK